MKKIRNLDEYKEILRLNKERIGKVEKNCYLMAGAMNKYIMEERLYVETYENGMVLYIDEGCYYNMYYFWKTNCKMEDFRQEKPVLIEELDNNGSRTEYINNIEQYFFDVGFEKFKNNLQLEMSIKDKKKTIEEQLSKKMLRLSEQNLQLEFCSDDDILKKSIKLWQNSLDVTDIPQEHMSLGSDDKLACILTEERQVVTTNWWRNTKKSSEGRHTVTHPEYFQRGLASTLLLVWCQEAIKQDVERCFTWVSDTNVRSLAMFKKLGFVPNGRSSKQYILTQRRL